MHFLADDNVPGPAVAALRAAGHDESSSPRRRSCVTASVEVSSTPRSSWLAWPASRIRRFSSRRAPGFSTIGSSTTRSRDWLRLAFSTSTPNYSLDWAYAGPSSVASSICCGPRPSSSRRRVLLRPNRIPAMRHSGRVLTWARPISFSRSTRRTFRKAACQQRSSGPTNRCHRIESGGASRGRVERDRRHTAMSDIGAAINRSSPAATKIALFRSLFRGREDVYPRRFESRKTGKSGYAPA